MVRVDSAVRLAWRAIESHRLRSLLAASSIAMGVFAVAAIVAAGQSARARIEQDLRVFGTTLIVATATNAHVALDGSHVRLTVDDARAIEREAPAVSRVAPTIGGRASVAGFDRRRTVSVLGTTGAYFDVGRWAFAAGSFFSPLEEAAKDRVCVLGDRVRRDLFGDADPVGSTVRVASKPFRVVGALRAKGQDIYGKDQDDVVILPIETFRARIDASPPGSVSSVLMTATAPDSVESAVRQADRILRERHRVPEGDRSDVKVTSQRAAIAVVSRSLDLLTRLLMVLAAVGLVVGGIGIMNVMLLGVAERRREIGVRMAIGARGRDIRTQMLIEACALSTLGGAAGMLLAGVAVLVARARLPTWPVTLDPAAVAVSLLTSTLIGVGFGYFPARRASMLDPVVALGRDG